MKRNCRRMGLLLLMMAFCCAVALPAAGEGEPIEITIMTSALSGESAAFFESLGDLYREAHPGTDVVIKHEAMSFGDLQGAPLQVRYASGTAPDIQLLTVEMTLTLVEAGYLQQLDRFYTDELRQDYYDGIVEGVSTFDGHQYTFMLHRGLEALYYDRAALTELGVAVPNTPEELVDAVKAVHSENRYGFTAFVDPNDHMIMTYMPFIWGEGGDAVSEDLSASALDTPEVARGLQHIRDLMESGAMDPMPTRSGNDIGILGDGETVFQLAPFGQCRTLAENYPERIGDLGVTRYPMPAGADFMTFGGGWALGVSAQSKHPEVAAEVANWIANEDNSTVISLVKTSGNMPCRRSVLQDPQMQAMFSGNPLYSAIMDDEEHLNGVRMAYVAPSEFNKILIDMIDRTLYETETPVETIAREQSEKMDLFLTGYKGPRDGLRRQSFAFQER